jgi:ankyrin repeat protein
VVKLLLERGADPTVRDLLGRFTALMHAARHGHTDAVAALLHHPLVRNKKKGHRDHYEFLLRGPDRYQSKMHDKVSPSFLIRTAGSC